MSAVVMGVALMRFAGTRVPVPGLFGHLEAGETIGNFLEGFPRVKMRQVPALLEQSKHKLLQAA
jgi:uncharacterized protein (DUF433 family)